MWSLQLPDSWGEALLADSVKLELAGLFKHPLSAVEAAVSEPWSNGRSRDNLTDSNAEATNVWRAGIELLRARLLPEPAFSDP